MLFKYVYDHASPATEQADSLKRYCAAFDANMEFFGLQEAIEEVEAQDVVPLIGAELYAELDAAYAAYPGTSLSAEDEAIIRKLQGGIAYLTLYYTISTRGMILSDQGPGQAVSSDGNYVFPSQWRTNEGLRSSFRIGHERLERALKHLHDNIAQYATYSASQAYTANTTNFFQVASDLEGYLPTEMDRIVFMRLTPAFREAERRYILPVTGETLAGELRTALRAGTMTSIQEQLLDKIRRALARWARIHAIPNMRLRIGQAGLVEPDMNHEQAGKIVKPAGEEPTRSLWIDDILAAREYTADLRGWLWLNAASFPSFRDSPLYNSEQPETAFLDSFNISGGGVGSLL